MEFLRPTPVYQAAGSEFQSLSLADRSLDQLRELRKTGANPSSVWSMCAKALGLGTAAAACDPGVEKVLEIIGKNPSQPFAADELAQKVHLSPSRLSHLFRNDVGVPIRCFIVWSRLREVVTRALDGASLTDAAHAAGFSDASHMSNSFRQMFGFAPSALFAHHIPKDVSIFN